MSSKIDHLVPQHKHDLGAVAKLDSYRFEEIEPVIPQLLEWLQDMNWPVARPIAEVLVGYGDVIGPYLMPIMQSDDNVWKYWIITVFGHVVNDAEFVNELYRLRDHATEDEKNEELQVLALEILSQEDHPDHH